MLQLNGDTLVFTFPEIHPEARLTIALIRTFRIPDDGKKYPLPPGFSHFPTKLVDDFKDRVPESWNQHGGVLVPMYQSEAMWLQFNSDHISDRGAAYPFAIRIATGKRSVVTGDEWTDSLKEGDYVVNPGQPWIDGYVITDGVIRQFIAAPLGQGFTAEEQITGKAEFGGLQIEVIPMKLENFEKRYPKLAPQFKGGGILRSRSVIGVTGSTGSKGSMGHEICSSNMICESSTKGLFSPQLDCSTLELNARGDDSIAVASAVSEMGMAPGGTMAQQIYKDPYGLAEWHETVKSRCFVHFLNSMTWRTVTKTDPPTVPITAADYSRQGLPWFDHYRDDLKSAAGTTTTAGLKGVAQLDKEKGTKILPENEPAIPKKIIQTAPAGKGAVRDGTW
jgi:hypothetical protein